MKNDDEPEPFFTSAPEPLPPNAFSNFFEHANDLEDRLRDAIDYVRAARGAPMRLEPHRGEPEPPPSAAPTFAELVATMRGLRSPHPLIASIAVASDVFDDLRAALGICRGSSVEAAGIRAFRSNAVPPGTLVPLDADGRPIPSPDRRTGTDARPRPSR